MIYFYEHKSGAFNTQTELDFGGYQGVYEFASARGMSPSKLFADIQKLEAEIKNLNGAQFDFSKGSNLELLNRWVDRYAWYFNNHAKHDKQAYVLIGNIASGKNTYAKEIEQETGSIIVDPDRFKMGEETSHGFFEGFTSLYHEPTDREQMQGICAEACKQTLKNISDQGMNLILPKAASSLEKLEKQLECLTKNGYDIHLILFDTPVKECVNRSYLRYLVKEYNMNYHSNGSKEHGRFVPKSVTVSIGDSPFTTFAKALNKSGTFASYKAFHNDRFKQSEEIDLNTMIIE